MVGTGGGAGVRATTSLLGARPVRPGAPVPSMAKLALRWGAPCGCPGGAFRATFGRRWPGYLAVALLVGLLGGLSMGAVAGARRTQSSFPVYLASTNPSDVQFFTEFAPSTNIGYSARVDRAIARVPYVRRSVVVVGFDGTLQALRPLPKDAVPGRRHRRSRGA